MANNNAHEGRHVAPVYIDLPPAMNRFLYGQYNTRHELLDALPKIAAAAASEALLVFFLTLGTVYVVSTSYLTFRIHRVWGLFLIHGMGIRISRLFKTSPELYPRGHLGLLFFDVLRNQIGLIVFVGLFGAQSIAAIQAAYVASYLGLGAIPLPADYGLSIAHAFVLELAVCVIVILWRASTQNDTSPMVDGGPGFLVSLPYLKCGIFTAGNMFTYYVGALSLWNMGDKSAFRTFGTGIPPLSSIWAMWVFTPLLGAVAAHIIDSTFFWMFRLRHQVGPPIGHDGDDRIADGYDGGGSKKER